jgi:ABC-type transport system involved in cytochrome bd biosynthesis fused ATPase/permease subunit
VARSYHSEMALRILLHSIDTAANRYKKYVVPWVSGAYIFHSMGYVALTSNVLLLLLLMLLLLVVVVMVAQWRWISTSDCSCASTRYIT